MKLDSASASDNLKVSIPDSGKSVTTNSETSETTGFMSQLSALLGGSSESSEEAQTSAAKQLNSMDEAAPVSDPAVDKDLVDQESVDEILDSDQAVETVGSTTSAGDGSAIKQKTDSTLDGEEASKVLAVSETVNREAQAKQAVSESDELLGRLNESNSALQSKESASKQDLAAPATVVEGESVTKVSASEQDGQKTAEQTFGKATEHDSLSGKAVAASGKELPHEGETSSAKSGAASIAAVSSQSQLTEKSPAIPNEASASTNSQQAYSANAHAQSYSVATPEQMTPAAQGKGVGAGMGAELSDTTDQAVETEHGHEQHPKAAVIDELTPVQSLNTSTGEVLIEPENQVGQTEVAHEQMTSQMSLASQATSNSQEHPEEVTTEAAVIPWGQNPKEVGHVNQPASDTKSSSDRSLNAAQSATVTAATQSSSPSAIASASNAVSPAVNPQAMDAKIVSDPSLVSTSVVPTNPSAVSPSANNSALQASLAATGVMAAKGDKKEASHLSPQDLAVANGVTSNAPTAQAARAEVNTAQGSVVISQTMSAEQMAEKANERVQVMLSKNLKNIDIRLDPPELGRMQIRMNMNGDTTTVHFTVANNQARDVVEQAMPRLREMLAQQGLQLGDTSVQQQSAGQQQGRFAQQGNGDGHSNAHGDGWDSEENAPETSMNLNVKTKQDGISFYA